METILKSIEESINNLKSIDGIKGSLEKIENKLNSKVFNLVVIGQFKRGKSTFINALLGEKVLPASILPLTSIVTILSYKDKPSCCVEFLDGSKQNIELHSINRYVTEKENPKNKLGVSEVHVYYPSEYLKKGIRIIDTPGVGSVFEHNSEVSYKYLPNCDAAIFLMSPDPPFGAYEFEFLKSAKEFVNKFFFVLNKIDIVSKDEVYEVIAFNKHLLANLLETDIDIRPVSAINALEAKIKGDNAKLKSSHISDIEGELNNFLENEKSEILYLSTINNILRVIDNQLISYTLKAESHKMTLEELENKSKKFAEFIETIRIQTEEEEFLLRKRIDQIFSELDNDIARLKDNKLTELLGLIENDFNEKLKQKPKTEEIEHFLTNKMTSYLKDIFSDFRKEQAQIISDKLEVVYGKLADRINEQIKSVIETASELFGVKLDILIDSEGLSNRSDFYFMLEDQKGVLNIISTSIRTTLPLFIGKKIALKHIKKSSVELFDRHCGRVRYDLLKRVQKTTLKFQSQTKEKLETVIGVIEGSFDKSIEIKKDGLNNFELLMEKMRKDSTLLYHEKNRITQYRAKLM
jgi:GTPase SAR1 family protein